MKKLLLFCLFCCTSVFLSAQSIKGTVLDKDTGKPIPDVIVQYGNQSEHYAYTDGKGKFEIPRGSMDVIYFQCFGYITKSASRTSLVQNGTVYMEINPFSLDPVVISPDDADLILEEVMVNTKENLVTEQSLAYLLHFLQTRSLDTMQNEIYLRYTTSLKGKTLNKNLKKERVPYVYNIIDIMRWQRAETPTSELFGAEYHASHLFTFGKSVNNQTTKSFSSDSTLMILEIKPMEGREGWANGRVIINREEMTIVSMEIESVDSILETQPYKKYISNQVKVLKKIGRFEFQKVKSKYYMNKCYTYYKFRTVNEFGREEDIMYECDVNFIGAGSKFQAKSRKLSGFCQELFYFPDSTKREFWLDYQDEAVYERIEQEFDENFVLGDKERGNKVVNLMKQAIVPVSLFGLLLFVL